MLMVQTNNTKMKPLNCMAKHKAQIKWMTKRHNTMIIFLVFMALIKYCEGGIVGCPIGFQLLETEHRLLCYKLKEPETYGEKYIDCHGNKDSHKLWKHMSDYKMRRDVQIWSDFLRVNEDGILISWSLNDAHMGKPLSSFSLDLDEDYDNGKKMCTVLNLSSKKLQSVDCNDKYPRYCIIDFYQELLTDDTCPTDEYFKFNSPYSTCLLLPSNTTQSSVRHVPLRVTWRQAVQICVKSDGYLLEKGYIYTNHPRFETEQATRWELPLGIQRKRKTSFFWSSYTTGHGSERIREDEWNFASDVSFENDENYVALVNNQWILVNDSNIFYYVICEHAVHLPRPNIITSYHSSGLLGVNVNNTNITEDQLWCFTDSTTYFPTKVQLTRIEKSDSFVIKPELDGYYWCISVNTTIHSPHESNKVLFVREKSSLEQLYAAMIHLDDDYEEEDLPGLEKSIQARLIDLVYYRRTMTKVFGTERANTTIVIKQIKRSRQQTSFEDSLYGLKIKRIYANRHKLLIHVYLGTNVEVLPEGDWKGMQIFYMRRAYYCEESDILPLTILGGYYDVPHTCISYKCSGDYNIGAYWEMYNNSEECQYNNEDLRRPPPPKTTTEIILPTTTKPYENTVSTTVQVEQPTDAPDPTPSQLVDNVITNLQSMANNSVVNIDNLTDAASQINFILGLPDVDIPPNTMRYFDTIIRRVDLTDIDGTAVKIIYQNMAVVVLENKYNHYVGMKLENENITDNKLRNNSIELVTEDQIANVNINEETTEIYVQIPTALTEISERISFVVFRDDRAFTRNLTQEKVNSRIVSVAISNATTSRTTFPEDHYIYIHLRPHETVLHKNETRLCAYWDFDLGESGGWSTDGCELIKSTTSALDTCRCNHLTHFSEIISMSKTRVSAGHDTALTIFSYVGNTLSFIGILLIGLTGVIFKNWRREFINKIWLNLSASIALVIISFFSISSLNFDTTTNVCIAVGVMLHYSLLASFSWMLISAVISYQRLVTVFVKNTSHRLLKASVFAWGFPLVFVGSLLIFNPASYSDHLTQGTLNYTSNFCYPTGLGYWLTVFLPTFLIMAVNMVLFMCIIYSVFISTKVKRHGDSQEVYRSITVSFLLFFLFGLTWIFGIFSHNILFNYLFCGFGTLQGFVLFIFFIIGNKKTRETWLEYLKIREKKKIPVTSSSSRISGYRRESNNGRLVNGGIGKFEDSNSTKPRSLSGITDNSRFS